MLTFICVAREFDKKAVKNYALSNYNGELVVIDSTTLKKKIKRGEIKVTNLKLTSDNRLILLNSTFKSRLNPEIIRYKMLNILFIEISKLKYDLKLEDCGGTITESTVSAYITLVSKLNNKATISIMYDSGTEKFHVSSNLNTEIFKVDNIDNTNSYVELKLAEYMEIPEYFFPNGKYTLGVDNKLRERAKEISVDKERHRILFVGTNVVYMGPRNESCDILDIPDYVNIVCDFAFDKCKDIVKIYASKGLKSSLDRLNLNSVIVNYI